MNVRKIGRKLESSLGKLGTSVTKLGTLNIISGTNF